MILELLHISCAAPEGHKHHDGQQEAERATQRGGEVEEEEGDESLERRPQPWGDRDGRRAGPRVWAVEREQGRMESAGGKDGRMRQ